MPQRPIVRRRQKQRRTRQLAEWRQKQAAKEQGSAQQAAPKAETPAK